MSLTFEEKLEIIEQQYFTHDEPVPFKNDLKLFPVTIKDYYLFYSLVTYFTIDKNKDIKNKGVKMSHLDYLLFLIEQEESMGASIFNSVKSLLELIFKEKEKIICDDENCSEPPLEIEKIVEYVNILNEKFKEAETEEEKLKIYEKQKSYVNSVKICPTCGKPRRDNIYIKKTVDKKQFFINHTEITSKDFNELRRLVCYQNIPDFDDEYIDPELKEALDAAARLRNPNNEQPTLEKQMACVLAGTSGYTYETLKNMTIRKFVLLLRTIDAKIHYMAYRQGELSGMVTFKGELTHWIWGGNERKKNKLKDVVMLDDLKQKINSV